MADVLDTYISAGGGAGGDDKRRCNLVTPRHEASGGSMYCATASLSLMVWLEEVLGADLSADGASGGDDKRRCELLR